MQTWSVVTGANLPFPFFQKKWPVKFGRVLNSGTRCNVVNGKPLTEPIFLFILGYEAVVQLAQLQTKWGQLVIWPDQGGEEVGGGGVDHRARFFVSCSHSFRMHPENVHYRHEVRKD